VSEPFCDDVSRVSLDPVGLAGGAEILQKPWPRFVSGLLDDPLEVGPQVHTFTARHRHDQRRPRLGLLERVRKDGTEVRADGHDTDRVVAAVVLGL